MPVLFGPQLFDPPELFDIGRCSAGAECEAGIWCIHIFTVMLILVLVFKDSLRTKSKSLSSSL